MTNYNFDLMMALGEVLRDNQIHWGSSSWDHECLQKMSRHDISVWTKIVDQPTEEIIDSVCFCSLFELTL